MPLDLREYQAKALNDLYGYFEEHTGDPLVVLPTGGGKSLVIAEWIKGVFSIAARSRVLVVTHVAELVEQNYGELISLWPDAPAGIYSAGLGKRQLHSRILFGSVQSLFKRAHQIQQCDLLLIDEAHLVPRNSETMYGRLIADLRRINPHMKVIGLTATAYRLDSGMLHDGDDRLFTHVAHETSVRYLIDNGWLVPLVSRTRKDAAIDTTGVHTRLGEFVSSELEDRALDPEIVKKIADDIVANGHDRRGWLVFGCSVAHCEALRDAIAAHGIAVGVVFGDSDKADRRSTIAAFKAQRLRCIVSMGVLTTGFNAKHVDLVALARPTKSLNLYVQMVGRGTRCVGSNIAESIANGKRDCLVLDYGGNIRRHGPFDEPFLPGSKTKGDGTGEAPMKECPQCEAETLIASLVCAACGFEFPPPEKKISVAADYAPVLAPPPEWLAVDDVAYTHHQGRDGKPDTLRVTYRTGLTFHNEWVCFDHPPSSYAARAAGLWWRRRTTEVMPEGVAEAAARAAGLAKPNAIRVRQAGRYTEVTDHRFDDERNPIAALATRGGRLPDVRTGGAGVHLPQPA